MTRLPHLTNIQYYNFVSALTILHDCRLENINFAERIINISGSPVAIQNCSLELEKLLGRYTQQSNG